MAVSKKGNPAVEPASQHEKIKNTILNWRSMKIQKKRENVPLQTERVKDLVDFSSKGIFEDIKVERKILINISKKASQRVKTPETEVEKTRKILEEKRIREIQKQREIALHKIDQIKDIAGFNDNREAEGREIVRLREIQKQREIARREIDQIKNTAGFNDNMEAEREYRKIVHLGEIQKQREIARREIDQIKNMADFNNNMEAKGREIARRREIQKQREIARREIDQIKNTAGFNDNIEAGQEFCKLTRGRFLSRDELCRLICFGEPLDPFFYQ